MTKRNKHTKEFKAKALSMSEELGSISEASKKLGINRANIYAWKSAQSKVRPIKRPWNGTANTTQRLLDERNALERQNIILRSAIAILVQDQPKKYS